MRREVKYGKSSRIDILLEDAARGTCFVEIKKCSSETGVRSRISRLRYVSWNKTSSGAFPTWFSQGNRAVMVYLVQREDCSDFRIASDIDPTYNLSFQSAIANGVEALCYSCKLSPARISLHRPIPIVFLSFSKKKDY